MMVVRHRCGLGLGQWPARLLLAVILGIGGTAAADSHAQAPLPEPEGRVILTVAGAVAVTNGDGVAHFDRAMLRALDQTRLATHTDWTEGEQVFTGPSLGDLLNRVGADGETLYAEALNDYAAEIPVSDVADHDPILALRRNGEPMSVRERGPIWIIYPHPDPDSELPNPHNTKSVWQLRRLTVRP